MEHGLHPPDYKLWAEIGSTENKPPTLEQKLESEKIRLESNQAMLTFYKWRRSLYLNEENIPSIINFDIEWLGKFIKIGQRRITRLEKQASKKLS